MPRAAVTRRSLLAIEGTQEVLDNIAKVIDSASGDQIKRVYMRAALGIRDQARQNVDRISSDRLSDKGKPILKETIIAAYGKDRRKQNVIVGVSQVRASKLANSLGQRYPNPYWFEFGTVERKTKTGHRTGHMTATPYFRPAVTSKRGDTSQELSDGIRTVLLNSISK